MYKEGVKNFNSFVILLIYLEWLLTVNITSIHDFKSIRSVGFCPVQTTVATSINRFLANAPYEVL